MVQPSALQPGQPTTQKITYKKVMIVGATSAIAQETAKYFAADGADLFLVARDTSRLDAAIKDLTVRGSKHIETYALDMIKLDQHQALIDTAISKLGGLDAVLIAYGTLSDQEKAQQSASETVNELLINFTSIAAFLTPLANLFEKQKHGTIAVIGSVAGDRGRASNYVYGSAKAGLDAFLSGLRNRLSKSGVHVLTIKPGRVDTPMTAGMKKSPLLADPGAVGQAIHDAMLKRTNVLYTPWYWRLIMLAITNIPESVYKKLSIK